MMNLVVIGILMFKSLPITKPQKLLLCQVLIFPFSHTLYSNFISYQNVFTCIWTFKNK